MQARRYNPQEFEPVIEAPPSTPEDQPTTPASTNAPKRKRADELPYHVLVSLPTVYARKDKDPFVDEERLSDKFVTKYGPLVANYHSLEEDTVAHEIFDEAVNSGFYSCGRGAVARYTEEPIDASAVRGNRSMLHRLIINLKAGEVLVITTRGPYSHPLLVFMPVAMVSARAFYDQKEVYFGATVEPYFSRWNELNDAFANSGMGTISSHIQHSRGMARAAARSRQPQSPEVIFVESQTQRD